MIRVEGSVHGNPASRYSTNVAQVTALVLSVEYVLKMPIQTE